MANRKPIFIIKAPMESQEEHDRIMDSLKGIREDYHVILIEGFDVVEFEMFSDEKIEPIELQKLKDLINGK